MQNYLLFIDTEASGAPANWNTPFFKEEEWPHIVQIAWIVYDKAKHEIKAANYYICDNDFQIEPAAYKIHGLTKSFLAENGERRKEVIKQLSQDLKKYKPLVIGHFLELDTALINVEYYRTGQKNQLKELPVFCTMQATKHLSRNLKQKYLSLNELYQFLFSKNFEGQHNALADAQATAECFFKLLEKGLINETELYQKKNVIEKRTEVNIWYYLIPLFILLSALIIYYFL
ncbi:exonuclease domain-containing protein [Rubrolithibacter danxiaensis]|uniref:3'-5' exonuclease n=1 Tax=Rubrolithibacter danxiaensis TaxID=3390805 RepID=UPI003BF7F868